MIKELACEQASSVEVLRFDPRQRHSLRATSQRDVSCMRRRIGGALYLVPVLRQVKDPTHEVNVYSSLLINISSIVARNCLRGLHFPYLSINLSIYQSILSILSILSIYLSANVALQLKASLLK